MTQKQIDIFQRSKTRFNNIIDAVEARCMATDGPVTPTLNEMQEDELASLWRSVQEMSGAIEDVNDDNPPRSNPKATKQAKHKRDNSRKG